MAVWRRKPKSPVIIHSDQGSQFGSDTFLRWCKDNRLSPSMSRRGNCWDNAVAESFFSSLKSELVKKRIYATREQARSEIFDYIEGFYNRVRRHRHLQQLSPYEFERRQTALWKASMNLGECQTYLALERQKPVQSPSQRFLLGVSQVLQPSTAQQNLIVNICIHWTSQKPTRFWMQSMCLMLPHMFFDRRAYWHTSFCLHSRRKSLLWAYPPQDRSRWRGSGHSKLERARLGIWDAAP